MTGSTFVNFAIISDSQVYRAIKHYCPDEIVSSTHRNKYRSKPEIVDGIKFPSQPQATRYRDLKIMERFGYISELRLEVTFLIEINGKVVRRYRADAAYVENGKQI